MNHQDYISVYVRSMEISPSGHYRVMQYLKHFDTKVRIRNIVPPDLYKYYLHKKNTSRNKLLDVVIFLLMYIRILIFILDDIIKTPKTVIISRGLLPRFILWPLPIFLNLLRKRSESFIWDFDDDILLSKEISKKEFNILQRISDKILVTHNYLADQVSDEYKDKCIILHTTDGDYEKYDIKTVIDDRAKSLDNGLNLVWIGSAVNLRYLSACVRALDDMAEYIQERIHKPTILTVCTSEDFVAETKSLIISNIRWTPSAAEKAVLKSHIGIMPLLEEKYALGKGGFKLIQYMAAGMPIIGSDIGFNKSIIRNDYGRLIEAIDSSEEWINAVCDLTNSKSRYLEAANYSRNEYEQKYNFELNLSIWKELIYSHKG